MENLSKHTPTELLKLANDTAKKHVELKDDITAKTFQIDEIEKEINEKLKELSELEKFYVSIVEEIDKRD